jgi:hypothetical protein
MKKKIQSLAVFFIFAWGISTIKAQNFPDSIKTSKEINNFLIQYSKATTMVDTVWLKSNLLDSFLYSDPLNYNINRTDYINMYGKGVYKITKADATVDKIVKNGDKYQVFVHSIIEGNAGGQPVSGTYPFLFKLDYIQKKYKIRSLEVSQ